MPSKALGVRGAAVTPRGAVPAIDQRPTPPDAIARADLHWFRSCGLSWLVPYSASCAVEPPGARRLPDTRGSSTNTEGCRPQPRRPKNPAMRPLLLTLALTRASVVDILSRDAPPGELLVAFPIATDDGRQLGDLEFYEKDAAVDTVAAYCSKNDLPSWFRKMLAAKVCERTLEADKSLLEKLPVCWRTRALYYEESIQAPDKDRSYPGKLEVWEDEDPTKAVEYFLLQAEKEILKNRTTWDAQHERWEKNRTKNVELVVETEHVARRRAERDKALKQISELDWLLDNHTLSEPMRVPNGWFRKALVDHVCSLPGLSCEGRRKPLPELPITVDGSDKPRGVVRMFEGDKLRINQSFTAPSCVHSTPST